MPRSDSATATVTKSDNLVQSTVTKLRFLLDGYRTLYPVIPPLPQLATLADVKDFCVGLSEQPESHPWNGLKMTPKSFESLKHSLFLFRKIIPGTYSVEEMKVDYLKKMSTPTEPTNPELLSFLRRRVTEMFKKGWDKSYRTRCQRLIFGTSATLCRARRDGGARAENARLGLVRRMAAGREPIPASKVRLGVVEEGIKARIVTISSENQYAFKPLHDMIYDHISREDWLLRGDAVAKSFRGFTPKEGETFVSGDYSSATDNIHLDVYQTVLTAILDSGNFSPLFREGALTHSVSEIFSDGLTVTQRRGQLMGNFLSFPILCIINKLCFEFALGRKHPVKVNGDDIVFRAPLGSKEIWAKVVAQAGLVVHPGKTGESPRFFSLNSTPFSSTNKIKVVPFVRPKVLFRAAEDPFCIKGSYQALCPGFTGQFRRRLQAHFLSVNRKVISFSQRSLTRGHGLRVTLSVLSMSRLMAHERFYRGLDSEPPLLKFEDRCCSMPVVGYKTVDLKKFTPEERREMRAESLSYGLACRLFAQTEVRQVNYRKDVQSGTIPLMKSKLFKKFRIGRGVRFPTRYGRRITDTPRTWYIRVGISEERLPPKAGIGFQHTVRTDF